MIIDQARFRKFSISTEPLVASLSANQPAFWPLDWEIVSVAPTSAEDDLYERVYQNSAGPVSFATCHTGDVLIAFSDPTDALMFKVSV
jgi:hypothetical protein